MPQRSEYQQYVIWSQGVDDGSITDPEIIAKVARWRETIRKSRAVMKARRQADSALRKAEKRAADDPEEKDPPPPDPEVLAPEPEPVVPDFTGVESLGQAQKIQLMECLLELRDRQFETLRLYQPLPIQKQFHESDAHIRIIRGGNRSGKSTATMCELAWALTGTHPDPNKYPRQGVKAIVVAKDNDKIGKVIWPLLGRPGAFRMVNDQLTGRPRLEEPLDRVRRLVTREAPPLVPKRLIKAIQWVSLKASQPKTLIMKNGSECTFYSSEADPFSIQGTRLHLAVLDEEIKNEGWFPEIVARLVDYGGRLVWGVTPQTGTQRLYDLGQRALEEQENEVEKPLIEEFLISIRDNPYITEEDKRMFILSLDDEDQIKIRVEGEHAIAGFKIYAPYFHPRGIHAVEPFPIPHDWTRFAAIDPGAQVAAVVFATCPPKRRPSGDILPPDLFGDFIYVYDEIYIKRCDAQKLAHEMKGHIADQQIREILIDHHGGMLTEIGSGKGGLPSTKVLTPTGWTTLGTIAVGDEIIDPLGGTTTVKSVHHRGVMPMFRVTFSDGSETVCSNDHIWLVNTPIRKWRGQPPMTLPLSFLQANGIELCRPATWSENQWTQGRYFIPLVAPIEFAPGDPLPIDPYLLGLLLGDGCFRDRTVCLSSADVEIVAAAQILAPAGCTLHHKSAYDYRFRGPGARNKPNPLTVALDRLGLIGHGSATKFIPRPYLHADPPSRIAILQGLLDADGSVSNGYGIEYTTVSDQLRDDVIFIVRSLGGIAKSQTRLTRYCSVQGTKKASLPSHRIYIQLPPTIRPFRLSRKQLSRKGKYGPTRRIRKIEPVGDHECICITVSADQGLYVTDDLIVTHNSPEQQYKEAFKAARVPVPLIGRFFTWGSDDLQGGILKVKEYLRPRPDGTPKLRIIRDAAPHLVSAIGRYQWKVVNGVTTDKPLARNVDSCDCLRYIVMHQGVRYQHYEGKTKEKKTAFEQFKEFQRRDLKRQKKKVGISL